MPKNKLKKVAQSQRENAGSLSDFEKLVLNVERDTQKEQPHVSLKYFDSGFQCFSDWQTDQLKQFSAFLKKLSGHTWTQIYQTGGSLGHKTGLGYTIHGDKSKLPSYARLNDLSEDITFFELRVDQQMRVHGFRVLDAFYLVWLDHAHQVHKS